jgi:hypothetical protein
VVSFGGLTDTEQVEKCLIDSDHSIHWINCHSSNDYIVRFVYRACILGNQSIGAGGLRRIEGHEVENVEVGELVKGHLNYR